MQLVLENEAVSQAMSLGPGYVVVCDRGICDAPAYVDQEGYAKVLEAIGISKKEAEARYDRVCFRNSLAVSLPEVYAEKTESNPARHESREVSAKLNAATLDAWRGHPGFEMLPANGIVPAIITGRTSQIVANRARELIYNVLNENGITIPFPQCDVHMIPEGK
jgi:hypothetical protein